MFDTLIVQPIFNLLLLIYALGPGFSLGLSIIIFTIIVRIAMWPLLKKQFHQTRMMRKLQPEIKKLKKKNKGDKQAEAQALMELYKENGVSPFSSIGLLLVQLPIFLGLFAALRKMINDPETILTFSYSWVREIGQMSDVVGDISSFNTTFLGIDMTQSAISGDGIVWGAMIIAAIAGIFQYLQTRQLQPSDEKKRSIREIMKDSAKGKEPDQGEINAAIGSKMGIIFAPLIFVISATSPAGLAVYFATSGVIGYLQQRFILNRDVEEMEEIADEPDPVADTGKKKSKKKGGKKKGKK